MELSQLHFHSWGLVARNKPRGTKTIRVFPIEYRMSVDEDVLDVVDLVEDQYDTDEGPEVIKVKRTNSIPAKWLKLNSNSKLAPDVRRNDHVLIWRLGDTDNYFWTDFNIANVKRLETKLYAWSADPDNPIKDDLSNAYWLELSTHDKHITLKTSMANGEPFSYTLQLNTGEGFFTLQDNVGNIMYMNSDETVIGFKNENGTYLKLDKKCIDGYAPDSINYTAVNTISFKCKDFKVEASNSMTFKTKTWTATTDTTTINGKQITFNADKVTSNAPKTACTGLLSCAALSVGGGGASAGGGCEVQGDAIFGSNVSVTGQLMASRIKCDYIHYGSSNH